MRSEHVPGVGWSTPTSDRKGWSTLGKAFVLQGTSRAWLLITFTLSKNTWLRCSQLVLPELLFRARLEERRGRLGRRGVEVWCQIGEGRLWVGEGQTFNRRQGKTLGGRERGEHLSRKQADIGQDMEGDVGQERCWHWIGERERERERERVGRVSRVPLPRWRCLCCHVLIVVIND